MQFHAITDFTLTVVRGVLIPDLIELVTVQCRFNTVDKVIAVQQIGCTDTTCVPCSDRCHFKRAEPLAVPQIHHQILGIRPYQMNRREYSLPQIL